ncbi:aminoglycoside 6-adenylyltransferase [Sporosarcina jiandibaonis]|uniref:aminoglycoside 6-adenylyltransferase n=1 Tax=Sporosarcina jiandibaonis TaxID=2715535 RepID=UPI001551FE96|nr:aminoglycoside 6-adenylyltransferase [Sporosarcina jiandibaonis]
MYSYEERNEYFVKTIENLKASNLIEGIIQLGSGVEGYKDEYSDIDLIIATSQIEDAETTKNLVHQTFSNFNPLYIKEKQFSKDIFLIIAIMENSLEFNVSIVPRELLTVRSPLWKVIFDKTGLVSEKMNAENEKFENKTVKYGLGFDISFEFVYCSLSFEKELKRNNFIYALKMLEQMREYTLIVQALNENKKLHQFKAYETLEPSFIKSYISTYPEKINIENLKGSAEKLKELFADTLKQSFSISMDDDLKQLLDKSPVY